MFAQALNKISLCFKMHPKGSACDTVAWRDN